MTITRAAAQAAIEAARGCNIPSTVIDSPEIIARVVLEAAAPHIAAAERERIRQLATDRNASYVIDCGDPGCPGSHAHMSDEVAPFAGLLTEGDTT